MRIVSRNCHELGTLFVIEWSMPMWPIVMMPPMSMVVIKEMIIKIHPCHLLIFYERADHVDVVFVFGWLSDCRTRALVICMNPNVNINKSTCKFFNRLIHASVVRNSPLRCPRWFKTKETAGQWTREACTYRIQAADKCTLSTAKQASPPKKQYDQWIKSKLKAH